jgi:hypothetical protein
MSEAEERDEVLATIDRIEVASGKRPVGWLGAGLAETWNTLDYLAEAGIRYVCDWVNDDQPYLFDIGSPPLVSLPYSVQTNDVPAYFEMKVSVPEFEAMLRRQFDTLYREDETIPRVMAIAVHPFVTGQPHRIGALDSALDYICSHAGVWRATGWEIVQHFLARLQLLVIEGENRAVHRGGEDEAAARRHDAGIDRIVEQVLCLELAGRHVDDRDTPPSAFCWLGSRRSRTGRPCGFRRR